MREETHHFNEKRGRISKKRAVLVSCILLILCGLGYLAVHRPVIALSTGHAGIHVRNTGRSDALIHRVDGFWYWAGQVAFVANMPVIHQRVAAGADSVRLQIPDIPTPDDQTALQGPFYMKIAVRYRMPGIPIFRYTTTLYYQYDPARETWASTQNIPPKYRALGNLVVGDIEKIRVSFH